MNVFQQALSIFDPLHALLLYGVGFVAGATVFTLLARASTLVSTTLLLTAGMTFFLFLTLLRVGTGLANESHPQIEVGLRTIGTALLWISFAMGVSSGIYIGRKTTGSESVSRRRSLGVRRVVVSAVEGAPSLVEALRPDGSLVLDPARVTVKDGPDLPVVEVVAVPREREDVT